MTSEHAETPAEHPPQCSRWAVYLACLLLVAAAVGVYANCLSNPLLFDDLPGIVQNPHIRQLWPPQAHLNAPPEAPTQGRPLVSFSFALNYAIGGSDPVGYHAASIAIHALTALLLFGVVRRTLAGEAMGERFGRAALPVAFISALLWAVHPLNSECINYVSQRTEMMMAMFFLLTLYCAVRASTGRRRGLWQVAAVAACGLGMMSKEVMVVAPLIVVLYDWAFRTKPYKAVLAARWRLYLGLAATWAILAWLMLANPRATIGAGYVGPFQYALNQIPVVMRYARLAVWPHPLIVDYGPPTLVSLNSQLLVRGLALIVLLIVTIRALNNSPELGFLGAWFFIILAPTSSVVPILTEVGAERRMYLPLAGLVVLAVVGGHHLLKRMTSSPRLVGWVGCVLALMLAVALGLTTRHRNTDYSSRVSIWRTGVAATPRNPRAQCGLGSALITAGQTKEAVDVLRRAIALSPNYANAHSNLATALAAEGAFEEAIRHFSRAVDLAPARPLVHKVWADSLLALGKMDDALVHYRLQIEISPALPDPYNSAASILARRGGADAAEAVRLAERAAQLTGRGHPSVLRTLASAYAATGQYDQAIAAAREALQLAAQVGDDGLAERIRQQLAGYQQAKAAPPIN